MLKTTLLRRSMFTLTGLAVALALSACLPVPLGDASKAKVDSRFVGAWEWNDGKSNVAVIRTWDEHTFLVDTMTYTGEAAAPSPSRRSVYKAWLHEVKGQTFMTLQPIEQLVTLPGEQARKQFLIAKMTFDRDQLTATGLDGGYAKFKDVATPTALETVVGENLNEVSMWVKPIVLRKVPQERIAEIEKLQKTFEELPK